MNGKRISKSFAAKSLLLLVVFLFVATSSPIAFAQSKPQQQAAATSALPDAPGEAFRATRNVEVADNGSSSSLDSYSADAYFHRSEAAHTGPAAPQMATASRWSKLVLPGQQAPVLTVKDKYLMGARDSVSPFSIASWFLASGWSHVTNGPPNYGTDKGAYGERLGAASLRDISEDIFSTSVMATAFHEDPRYYRLGRSHSIGRRVLYAATRVLITRTDSGHATPNLALLTGNLAGAALTNAYYPPLNHGARQTMLIYGSSLGGSALGFGVNEFLDDALQLAHIKKSE